MQRKALCLVFVIPDSQEQAIRPHEAKLDNAHYVLVVRIVPDELESQDEEAVRPIYEAAYALIKETHPTFPASDEDRASVYVAARSLGLKEGFVHCFFMMLMRREGCIVGLDDAYLHQGAPYDLETGIFCVESLSSDPNSAETQAALADAMRAMPIMSANAHVAQMVAVATEAITDPEML